jgi:hypothetical protein
MKNLLNNIDSSEKNRILEMHKKRGYNTIISESPMDSMFYQGDDYTKDAGQSLKSLLEELKSELSSNFSAIISEIPNPESLISSANKFFGGDVSSMSTKEIENKINEKLGQSDLSEGFWGDFIKKDYKDEKKEYIETPIKDVEGGIVQKIGSLLMKIFGVNILSFGMIGSILASVLGGLQISPPMSMVISIVAFVVINILRRLAAFTKERYSN